MSRTYRRLDAQGLEDTKFHLQFAERNFLAFGNCTTLEEYFYKRHTDNSRSAYSPNRIWKRMSHKRARARQREELKKVMLDPEHDYNIDLEDEAHGLDLWDWY